MKKIAILILLLGVVVTITGVYNLLKINTISDWKSTQGKVIKSQINSRRVGPNHSMRYKALIEYKYEVKGHEYISGIIYPGYDYMKNIKITQNYLRDYPQNKEVIVFYDPNNPAEAVLEKDNLLWKNYYLWGGLLLIGLSLFLIFKRQNR